MPTIRLHGRGSTLFACLVLASAWIISASGCASTAALERLADETYGEINRAKNHTSSSVPAALPYLRQCSDISLFLDAPVGTDDEATQEGEKAAEPGVLPFKELSLKQVIKSDVKALPADLLKGFKDTYTPKNIAILLIGAGLDYWAAKEWDSKAEDYVRDHRKWREAGDYGEVIGHPAVHFGFAGIAYLASVKAGDEKTYEMSKTMIQALAVSGISTVVLKVATNIEGPQGEDQFIWPSGHTSSSFCVAAVLDEYYGHKVGIPAYIAAGYLGATRVTDHRHYLSDVLYGALLGSIVGHSVARGRLPEIAGFKVLPYQDASRGGGGVLFIKSF